VTGNFAPGCFFSKPPAAGFRTWVLFFKASGGGIYSKFQLVARRNGTRVPKQNHDRRAAFHVWHPGAIQKGASAVKKGTRVYVPIPT